MAGGMVKREAKSWGRETTKKKRPKGKGTDRRGTNTFLSKSGEKGGGAENPNSKG